MKKVGIIVGSIRKNSLSGLVANNLAILLKKDVEVEFIEIADLPLYNQDYDALETQPESYTRFREQVKAVDGLVIITPEHNRAMPAALKNALDVGSRPWGQSAWNGKKALVVSQSPGKLSGFGAATQVKNVLSFLNVQTIAQPEAYLAESHTLFDDKGELISEETKKFFWVLINSLTSII